MKAKLTVGGKEIEVEISEEELEKLKAEKRTGYERAEYGEIYYHIDGKGEVYDCLDRKHRMDSKFHELANYYTDKQLAENCARADRLLRQLRRFAVEHREKEIDWTDGYEPKYYIAYAHNTNTIEIHRASTFREFGQIYFDSKETAEIAIETFEDELEWYFTEFKDSL